MYKEIIEKAIKQYDKQIEELKIEIVKLETLKRYTKELGEKDV